MTTVSSLSGKFNILRFIYPVSNKANECVSREAYCHGLMNGEAIQDLPKDEEGDYVGRIMLLK